MSCFACQAFTAKECNEFLRVYDGIKHPGLAFLWKSFDKRNACVSEFLHRYRDKPHLLEIHFSNEAGRRNRRLARYEFLSGYSVDEYNHALVRRKSTVVRAIQRQALAISTFVLTQMGAKGRVLLTTGLEDNFTDAAYRSLHPILRRELPPIFKIGRNPNGSNATRFDYSLSDFIELHGSNPYFGSNRCLANLDGTDIGFRDGRRHLPGGILLSEVPAYIRRFRGQHCDVFLWWSEPQGIYPGARFVDPRNRSFGIYRENINAVNQILRRIQNE